MKGSRKWPFVVGIAACVMAFVAALLLGAITDANAEIIFRLRLPRAILAGAVGMGLAVAGATLQALFANPLCEPYTLGISSGATLGAVLATSFGLDLAISGLAAPAFAGAILFAGVLYLISCRPGTGNLTLLLTGVMLGFFGSSLVALWMALSDSNGLQAALFWLLGDLSRARLSGAIFSFFGIASMTVIVWSRWRELDALLLGEEGAASLGVDVTVARRKLVLLSSVLIGLCVSSAGMIGFVGLVVPHFARRWTGALHLRLIPLSALFGAATLILADTLARALARPYELPVGVVTALVGVPVFLHHVILGRTVPLRKAEEIT